MKKITLLLFLCSTFTWAQTLRVDVSELTNVANVQLVANFGGSFAVYQAADEGGDLWNFDVSTSMDAQNEYVWLVTFNDTSTQQEAMAGKIGGTGVDNDIAVDEFAAGRINTDFFSFCNRIVVIGQPDPPAFIFNSFREPGVTYSEITVTAPSGGDPYYLFYEGNGFSNFGGPGAIDNGDGTHTALVRPNVGFEYKWVLNNNPSNQVGDDTEEDLLACTDDDVQINTDNANFGNRIHAAGSNNNDVFDTCPPPLSVDEFNVVNVSVFPNPTQNDWTIKASNQNSIVSIQVFDVLGKNVISLSPSQNTIKIDASTLKSGLYFAKVNTNLGSKSIKLIKE